MVVKPLVDALFVYLKQHESEVGTEKLREAFTYALNQEKYLRVFLTANYVQTECQFRYCGTAIPFLTVRSTAR